MLRITHHGSDVPATVGLDGRLVGPWVDEVRSVVTALRSQGQVRLNLQNLSFADVSGLELLSAMRRDGVPLIGGSPLIEGLLASRPDLDAGAESPSAGSAL
jgi:anti-anti-sigma regulatory factor